MLKFLDHPDYGSVSDKKTNSSFLLLAQLPFCWIFVTNLSYSLLLTDVLVILWNSHVELADVSPNGRQLFDKRRQIRRDPSKG